jgi:hypothetical protein
MALTFAAILPTYDAKMRVVWLPGWDGEAPVRCAVSREALMDMARSMLATDKQLMEIYIIHADEIRQIAMRKYITNQAEPDGSFLVKTTDLNR